MNDVKILGIEAIEAIAKQSPSPLRGAALAAFSVGVWAYSIGAVKQDAFDDVDEEARQLMAGSGMYKSAVTDAANAEKGPATDSASSSSPVASILTPSPRRGILPPLLEHRIPRLFDPSSGTLVWGAPPLDNIGRLGDSSPSVGSRRI